jgi:hypothetical protein
MNRTSEWAVVQTDLVRHGRARTSRFEGWLLTEGDELVLPLHFGGRHTARAHDRPARRPRWNVARHRLVSFRACPR